MSGNRKWKDAAALAYNELCKELETDRYLDHEIRAVEWLLTKKGVYGAPYTILRKPNSTSRSSKGRALLFSYGAQIWYNSEGSRLEIMISIGHELGHIYLHHLSHGGVMLSENLSKDRLLETQATYFSKQIVKRRSDLFKDKNYIAERQYDNQTIDAKILDFYSDYDESMPDPE